MKHPIRLKEKASHGDDIPYHTVLKLLLGFRNLTTKS